MELEIKYHIYEKRIQKEMSSRRLETLSGISKSTINNIENNRCDPTIRTLCQIAEALNTKPEMLFTYKVVS